MPVRVNNIARTKSSASKKAKQMRSLYKPYYSSVGIKIRKLTPLDHRRDKNLKGYSYLISANLKSGKPRRRRK